MTDSFLPNDIEVYMINKQGLFLYKYPPEIRTVIYTTNPIESVHRQIRKVTKSKSSFPNEQALLKMVYLAVENAAKKWTMRQRDWSMIYSQLMIFFEDRLAKYV